MDDLLNTADDAAPLLPGFKGKRSAKGVWENINWIMTEDHDGQIELSISSGHPPKPPSPGRSRAFLRYFKLTPLEAITRGVTIHMVIRKGVMQ